MSIDDQIKSLTKNEMTVLYWKCRGLKYEQIRSRLGYSKDWVQLQMSTAYAKLGFKKSMHWTERTGILKKDVCPRLPKTFEAWEPREEVIEKSTGEVIETKADPEMMALVVYDEHMLAQTQSPQSVVQADPEIIQIPSEIRRRSSCLSRILTTAIFLAIVVVAGYVGYFFGRRSLPQVPLSTADVVIVTATFPPATETPDLTETSLPTLTLTVPPTFTPLPTATAFVPPADGVLFQANFDDGDLSAWTQYGSQWIVSDGQLTILAEDVDTYQWIALKKPEWKNYILSLTVNIPFQGSAAQSDVAVVLRNEGSQSKYLGVPVDTIRNRVYWAFVEDDGDTAIAGLNEGFYFESGSNMELEAQGDTYTLRVNGREIQKITLSGYDSGGISLGIYCYYDLGCPGFDNVKVTYLP